MLALGRAHAPRPASLRLPVPERVLRMAEFGLCVAPGDERVRAADGWWRRVEREMEAAVFAYLPAGASEIAMELDAEAMEVVVDFVLPG